MEDGGYIKGHKEFALDTDAFDTDRIHRNFQLAVVSLIHPSFVDTLLKTREKSTIYFAQAIAFRWFATTIEASAITPVKYVSLHGLCIVVFYRVSFFN